MFAFSPSLSLTLSLLHAQTHTHTLSLTLCLSLDPSSHRYLVKCTGSRISFKPYSLSRVRCRSVIFSRERLTEKKRKKKNGNRVRNVTKKGSFFTALDVQRARAPRCCQTWGKRSKELRIKFRRFRTVAVPETEKKNEKEWDGKREKRWEWKFRAFRVQPRSGDASLLSIHHQATAMHLQTTLM